MLMNVTGHANDLSLRIPSDYAEAIGLREGDAD